MTASPLLAQDALYPYGNSGRQWLNTVISYCVVYFCDFKVMSQSPVFIADTDTE